MAAETGQNAVKTFNVLKLLGIDGNATLAACKSHSRALFNPQSAPQLHGNDQLALGWDDTFELFDVLHYAKKLRP